MSEPLDVLVVGAGPVGLAVACHLTRLGLRIAVIEKRSGPSQHSKAIGLQYRVSETLARMGLIDEFLKRGGNPTSVNIYTGEERLLQLKFVPPRGTAGRDAFEPRAIVIPQSETERILIADLIDRGNDVRWQTELTSYHQESDRVIVRVNSGQQESSIETRWLVGCEGAHSVVRRQEAIDFRGKTYPLAFLMADVRMSGPLPHAENHVWLHRDGSLAALPLPELNTWRLFIEITRQPPRSLGVWTIGDVQDFMSSRAAGVDAQIVGDPLWLSEFRINCRMVDRMHQGRAFLAGDAAHIHSPTGGQGITTGLQDAVNLAWKLGRVCRGAPAELLDTYDEERLPHAAEVLQETDRTTNVFFAPTRALRVLRDGIVLPLLRNRWVQGKMFGKLSQLHTNYRNSSLSQHHAGFAWRAIRAGDRSPDVAFADSRSGRQTTLFDLMRTVRPIVLFGRIEDGSHLIEQLKRLEVDAYGVTSKTAQSPIVDTTLVDIHDDFRRLYGLRGNFMCLIRPDGYLGLVSVPASRTRLIRYLEKITNKETVRAAFGGTT